jgi:hypothetical protein
VILEAQGGLCNRLRTILSRAEKGLVVYWEPNWEVACGRWDDVLEPLEGIQIVYSRPDHVDMATCEPAMWRGWQHRLLELRPVRAIEEQIIGWRARLGGEYAAMHIRRTDGSWIAREENTYQEDAEFHDFARSFRNKQHVFLATDNGETQRKFHECISNVNLSGLETCGRGDHTRHSSLEDTVVDFFVCARAQWFKGTRSSSFSTMVEQMREVTRWR